MPFSKNRNPSKAFAKDAGSLVFRDNQAFTKMRKQPRPGDACSELRATPVGTLLSTSETAVASAFARNKFETNRDFGGTEASSRSKLRHFQTCSVNAKTRF